MLAGAFVATVAEGVDVVGVGKFALGGAVRKKPAIDVPMPSTRASKLRLLCVTYVAVMLRLDDIVTLHVLLAFPPAHSGDANHPVKRRSPTAPQVPDATFTLEVATG